MDGRKSVSPFLNRAPPPTALYTLSLHDALPIFGSFTIPYLVGGNAPQMLGVTMTNYLTQYLRRDRKSTRLNSSHVSISYAVFCLKKKKLPDGARPDFHTPI